MLSEKLLDTDTTSSYMIGFELGDYSVFSISQLANHRLLCSVSDLALAEFKKGSFRSGSTEPRSSNNIGSSQ